MTDDAGLQRRYKCNLGTKTNLLRQTVEVTLFGARGAVLAPIFL